MQRWDLIRSDDYIFGSLECIIRSGVAIKAMRAEVHKFVVDLKNELLKGDETTGGDGWVAVEDKWPDLDTNVLTFNGNYIGVLEMKSGGNWRNEANEYLIFEAVSHWMPLPLPPSPKKAKQ